MSSILRSGAVMAAGTAVSRLTGFLRSTLLVVALGGGLHAANIGNLRPGDEIMWEARFAQLLAFEQGRLRLAIPAAIASRIPSAATGGGT